MKNSSQTKWFFTFSIFVGLSVLFFLSPFTTLRADWEIDFETGAAISGYNDVRIPGDTGTKISLSRELDADPSAFFRARVTYNLSKRHAVSVFAAPLTLKASGKVNRAVTFQSETFPPNTPLEATYRFDSYRLTYRYELVQKDRFSFWLGFTGKIRDAAIRLESATVESEYTNTGFVPLINFKLGFMPWNRFGFLIEGDALAAPQGRAEDVLFAFTYKPVPKVELKTGYRFLEGGADNEKVYTFAFIHYIVAGVVLSL
jgi:hypothetical protein